MSNNGIVNIHGKDYMTVAKRLELVHVDHKDKSLNIETEVLQHTPMIVVKARILTNQGIFTGISAVDLDSSKAIEKQNPYEVAETSAVGRALGFAGYGLIESVASADEVVNAIKIEENIKPKNFTTEEFVRDAQEVKKTFDDYDPLPQDAPEEKKVCSAHETPQVMFRGVSKSKFDKEGNPKVYWWHKDNGKMCFGDGFKD